MIFFQWFLFISNACLFLYILLNITVYRKGRYFKKSIEHCSKDNNGKVFLSVLIPARDEEKNIKNCLSSILSSGYKNLEVIVLDDQSSDDTFSIASSFKDSRLKVIRGKPIPQGWIGKNWACHQLSQKASGDYLLFTDADTVHTKNCHFATEQIVLKTHADLISGYPAQIISSAGEALIVPLIGIGGIGMVPVWMVNSIYFKGIATACGQFLLFKKESYEKIKGFQGIKDYIQDDVSLALKIKRAGMKVHLTDISGLVTTHMYAGWKEALKGFSKSIFASCRNSYFLIFLSLTGIVFALFFPFLFFIISFFRGSLILGCLTILTTFFSRLLTDRILKIPVWVSLIFPASAFTFFLAGLDSVLSKKNREYIWKGRKIDFSKD